jgi:hypothetical protein
VNGWRRAGAVLLGAYVGWCVASVTGGLLFGVAMGYGGAPPPDRELAFVVVLIGAMTGGYLALCRTAAVDPPDTQVAPAPMVSFERAREIVARTEPGHGWTAGTFMVSASGHETPTAWVVHCGYREFLVDGDDGYATPGDGVRLVHKSTGRVEVANPVEIAMGPLLPPVRDGGRRG